MGGTQRLGAYPAKLKPGTATAAAYDNKKKFQNVIVTVMNLITSSEKILKMLA